MSVRLQRGDLGLLLAAIAAVALIGTFLARTSGSPEEDADADERPTPTTAAPRAGPVRIRSNADPDLEWSRARAAFRVDCDGRRVQGLEVTLTRLPSETPFGWRAQVDAATGETASLDRRRGVTAEVTEGDGRPSRFLTTDTGRGAVRFAFESNRPDVPVPLVLIGFGVPAEDAQVLAAPFLSCRGN